MVFSNPTPSVSVEEAERKVHSENVEFIDVRTSQEYGEGHARGARNYPLKELNPSQIEELKRFAEVYVICQTGGRSMVAANTLRSSNVNAINVTGGTSAWQSSDLPIA